MNKSTKVSVILQSLKDAKAKYVEVLTPLEESIMKIKINVTDEDLVGFLDEFYDAGFTVRKITKEEYDLFAADENLRFSL